MYTIKQKQTSKNWLGREKTKLVVHTFTNHKEALKFALNEQIRYYSHCIEGNKPTSREAYKMYYSCLNWVKLAEKHPIHYTGRRRTKYTNLERLYYYYVNSNNLHRIRKHL